MAKTKKIKFYVVIGDQGNYEVHDNKDDAIERYQEYGHEDGAINIIEMTAAVPLPQMLKMTLEASNIESVEELEMEEVEA